MPDRVRCPACRSELSPDGKTLFERSDYLVDLEKSVAKLPELTASVERLTHRLEQQKAALRKAKDDVAVPKGRDEGKKAWFRK